MAYAIVRTDACKSTKSGNILSGRFYVGTTPTAIENGNIVKLDGLISGQRDLWKCVAPGAITEGNLYLVASPEIIYSEELKSSGALENFRNAAGANLTLIPLEVGDVFSVSDEAITPINDDDGIPAVGSYVTPSATGTKFTEIAAASLNTEVFRGKIVARELFKKNVYLNTILMEKVR